MGDEAHVTPPGSETKGSSVTSGQRPGRARNERDTTRLSRAPHGMLVRDAGCGAALRWGSMERAFRVAKSFREAAEIDRRDVAALSLEERISLVEAIRRKHFGERGAESRLERVLVCADLPSRALRAGQGSPRRR